MNPSTAFARVLVDELLRGGVTDAVLAPGSRSAPVALALAGAERNGRLRLHVRIDERTAAFLALGLAKASGRPVPVLTTSGTAAAHLHAAVLEADASGVPLLALTADRPPELRATGANQTIEQAGLYGGAVRWAADVGVPEAARDAAQNRYWRSLVARALITARGDTSADPGPVHLNLAFREPLLPDDEDTGQLDVFWTGRPDGAPWTAAQAWSPATAGSPPWRRRTLVVIGDGPPSWGRVAADVAAGNGWPVVAEPSSGGWSGLRAGALLLDAPEWLEEHRPDQVVVVGRPTLSRPVSRLLADDRIEVITTTTTPAGRMRPGRAPRWASTSPPGPVRRAPSTVPGRRSGQPPPSGWEARWTPSSTVPLACRRHGSRGTSSRPCRRGSCSCWGPRRPCATSTGSPCRGQT
ncbi:2-succinyl-5-enolpyruvyl-6-hydroxy-3-cyclohexene-1-carboxylic-acid synthase [Blastococcus sp. PRF04-17]|uniref:2-succinyl-5-enolpyruvyl-6-hydroxy-3- cyclohexene-1-carboxylic-acid synthase n=1 Tax=Blastococcus sp. PRF04-17 TaxID=2933797 RepID=UPI001FF48A35|nr:2-succinyl-5-enolpyruvyl-6-hydroxy-3-cyclohexene-1-carboxylic-acid synthase [Blastococcus sp. PRF04-17]UOY00989.1 2-succinyl-5-enolpyruvyl-6-hydroxy-3-cyclohexene-1-carboxylic-acid synthase [Blastococcus sp. PRF04-17]